MQRSGYLLIPALLLFNIVFGQQSVATVDALSLLNSQVGLAYEYSFTKAISAKLRFAAGRYATGQTLGSDDGYKLTGIGIVPEFRYYPFHANRFAPRGFFVGAAYRYLRFEQSYEDPFVGISEPRKSSGTINNVGIDAGYKFNYKQFCLELVLGAGTGSVKNDSELEAYRIPAEYSRVLDDEKHFYRAEVSFGYIFPKWK